MKRVIITGPTGTIGMALLKLCTDKGIHVCAIVNPLSRRKAILPNHPLVTILEKDISEYNSLHFVEQYDVWFHLAWCGASGAGRNDMYMQNQNITYMLDAIEAAKKAGCHTFVGAGSQAEYGASNSPLSGNSPTFPTTGYGMAKLCAGQMGRMVCKEAKMRYIWPRIFSVYGPYDGYNTMIMTGIRQLLDGDIPMFTKGEQQWDYLYCDDAAKILLSLAKNGRDGKIYCLGSGKVRTLAEYIEIIRKNIDENAKINLGGMPYSDNQLMYLCADTTAIKQDIGYDEFVSFEDGIVRTIEWVKAWRKDNV